RRRARRAGRSPVACLPRGISPAARRHPRTAGQLHLLHAARPDDLVEHPPDRGAQLDRAPLTHTTAAGGENRLTRHAKIERLRALTSHMLRHRRARPMVALSSQAGPVSSPFNPEQQRRFDEQFEKAVAKYPPERRRSALLAVLHLAQDELGWLSEPTMAYVGW